MQRYNFNVTIPLFDWLYGTMAPKESAPESAVEAAPKPR
jgi:hypothetical protein